MEKIQSLTKEEHKRAHGATEGMSEALEIADLQNELDEYKKENVELTIELLQVSSFLSSLSKRMVLKSFSELAETIKNRASDIKEIARNTKFFRKENENEQS